MTSTTSSLGFRIRALRSLQKRTLKEIAGVCGFTVSLLSKIESGKSSPPVATLEKICNALGIAIADLFVGGKGNPTVCTSARKLARAVPTRTDKGYSFHLLASQRTDKLMQPFLFVAEKGRIKPGALSHHGEEFVYILEGELNYRVGETTYRLGPGDSLYFNAEEAHDLKPISPRVRYLAVFLDRPEKAKAGLHSTKLNGKKHT